MILPLEDALRQCDRHAQRMNRAMQRIPFPLVGPELAEDNEELITRQAKTLNRAQTMIRQITAWRARSKLEFELRKSP